MEGDEESEGRKAMRLLIDLQKGQIQMQEALKFLKNQISHTDSNVTRLVGNAGGNFLKLDVLIGCQTMCAWDRLCEQVNLFQPVSIHTIEYSLA